MCVTQHCHDAIAAGLRHTSSEGNTSGGRAIVYAMPLDNGTAQEHHQWELSTGLLCARSSHLRLCTLVY